jgi:hypothetical protein
MDNIAIPPQFAWLARVGYASRGVIYLVIGGLAFMTAAGAGGRTTDSKGALATIASQPFGRVMVAALIVGLIGYTLWRLIQAIKDVDHQGTSIKGIAIRAGLVGSAVAHAALALWATRFLMNEASADQRGGTSFLTTDFGQLFYVVAGVVLAIVGFAHMYKGWTARYERYMNIPRQHSGWADPMCRFGLIARGVVWCIVAWFFVKAAGGASSGDVSSLSDALTALRDSVYGSWLLGVVAAGLFAFGVYSCLEALYRRVDVGSPSASATAISGAATR